MLVGAVFAQDGAVATTLTVVAGAVAFRTGLRLVRDAEDLVAGCAAPRGRRRAGGATVEPASAEVAMIPQNYVKLTGKEAQQMLKLMEVIEEHDDVQHVWANFDIEEKEIEASLA